LNTNKSNILFVSHDANRAGAQIFLLNIMLHLKKEGHDVKLLLVDEWGDLKATFQENFKTYILNKQESNTSILSKFKAVFKEKQSVFEEIKADRNIDFIYVNTIASVHISEQLKLTFNVPIITHIHELSYSIYQYGPKEAYQILDKFSDKIIACSAAVAQNLILENENLKSKTEVVHSFVDNEKVLKIKDQNLSKTFREKLGIKDNEILVGACGNADWRKATDIFVQIAAKTYNVTPVIHFVWIGIKKETEYFNQIKYDAKKLGAELNIIWVSPTPEAISFINALDIFLVCSREDPFPLVMLEAALCEKPIVGFINTGGAEEFIGTDAGILAEYLNIDEISEQLISLSTNCEQIHKLGKNAQTKVIQNFSFDMSIQKIEKILNTLG
jgi:glycosyltransferase involved in cell wall biosynthesis